MADSISEELDARGYSRDEATRVWARAAYRGIAYNDGDTVELRLMDIVRKASDLSIFSQELAVACTDWPSTYHFSPLRANILRPFADRFGPGTRALEIGAGCGAITRFLGESDAQVLALEGSPRRAEIAAARTRDLDNVTVVAERFEDLDAAGPFDVITLIGVLEYASLFSGSEPPALRMLERVHRLLVPGGRLIVAIENQLGLKYFAGVPEDHCGIPMVGIENGYAERGPRTFGCAVLDELIAGAGFKHTHFFAPFPDYKLPLTVLTEAGASAADFDAAAFAWQSVKADPQMIPRPNFSLERSWPVIFANGLGLDLANSFLVEARKEGGADTRVVGEIVLAYHYGGLRKDIFSRETLFVRNADGCIEVRSSSTCREPGAVTTADGSVRHHLIGSAPYIKGTLLSVPIVHVLEQPNWQVAQLVASFRAYMDALRKWLAAQWRAMPLASLDEKLPCRLLDAIPRNLIRDEKGTVHYFDSEWEPVAEYLEFGWLLFRSVLHSLMQGSLAKMNHLGLGSVGEVVDALFAGLGLPLDPAARRRYVENEAAFQLAVTGVGEDEYIARIEQFLALPLAGDRTSLGRLVVYFSDEQCSFSEANTVVADIDRASAVYSLPLPARAPRGARLRLDPRDSSGWFEIHEISLRDADANALWTWKPGMEGVAFVGVVSWVDAAHPNGEHLFAWDNDPQLLLQLPDEVAAKVDAGCEIVVDLRLDGPPRYAAEFRPVSFAHIDIVRQQEARAEHARVLVRREALVSAAESALVERMVRQTETETETDAALAERSAVLDGREDELARRTVEQAQTQETIEKERAEMARLAAENARLQKACDEIAERLALNDRELSSVSCSLASFRSKVGELEAAGARLAAQRLEWQRLYEDANAVVARQGAELARSRAAYELLFRDMQALKASTLWRAMERVKALLVKLSPGQRRMIRRAVKVGWWAVTPHRLPARWRFLRQRKQQSRAMQPVTPLPVAVAVSAGAASPQPAPRPTALRFVPQPGGGNPDVTAPENGRYEMVPPPAGYTYVPLREPEDLPQRLAGLGRKPFFSIVVPTYNTPVDLLQRMLASVQTQWYPHWQLILVDDKSLDPTIREALARLDDPRILVHLLDENRGISGATNEGLKLASGDYVVFLDHDDELTCDCLFELATRIDAHDPDFVYSDEDKIDTDGSFTQPFFKPDWSPDTMMSTMYTCHVSCVRRTLMQGVGGLRSEYDGSQDWDFILRLSERTSRIVHIPKVLYHWRIIPASVSSDLAAKPYAVEAGRSAREDALRRRGLEGELRPVAQLPGYYRVHYRLQGQPLFSIIIPSKNNGEVLRSCVDSIRARSSYRRFEIVVIDNGSSEPATLAHIDALRQLPQVNVVRYDVPFNYSQINNFGVRQACGDILVFLNDDTEVLSEDWLESLGGYAQLGHMGAVGAKLLYPQTMQVQHSGVVNLADGPNHAFHKAHKDDPCNFARNLLEYNWIAVTGACMVLERAKFEAVGGFDETFPVAYNDVELCFRLVESGLYNVVCPGVELLHYESLTRGLDVVDEAKRIRLESDKLRLYQKHPRFYMSDPFHNPNFAPNDVFLGLP